MPRTCLLVVAMTILPSAARASDPNVRILLDPHAGSSLKMRAAGELARSQDPDAVAALVRQSRYDMAPVREKALESLSTIVGRTRAEFLHALPEFPNGPVALEVYSREWMKSIRDFQMLPLARTLLEDPDPKVRQIGYDGVLRMYAVSKDKKDSFLAWHPPELKEAVVAQVSRFDGRASLKEALGAVRMLDEESPAAAPLVLRALADEDAEVRAAAGPFVERLFTPLSATSPAVMGPIARGLVSPEPRLRAAAEQSFDRLAGGAWPAELAQAAERQLGPLRGRAVQSVIPHLAALAVQGDGRAWQVLVDWHALDFPVVRLADRLRSLARDEGKRFAFLLEDYAAGTPNPVAMADLLTHPEPGIRREAAWAIAALKERLDALRAVDVVVARGSYVDAEVLKGIGLTTDDLAPRLRPFIQTRTDGSRAPSGQRVAALEVLKATGAPATAGGRAELEALLDDPDPETRLTAAQVLGDPAAIARVRLAGWVKDLRSDALSARMLAARQIQGAGVYDPAFCAALVRAVERRDMAVREGLTRALERSAKGRQTPDAVLRALAVDEADPATRAYARAALRELP